MKLPTDTIPELKMAQNANNYSQWYFDVNTNHWSFFIIAFYRSGNIAVKDWKLFRQLFRLW